MLHVLEGAQVAVASAARYRWTAILVAWSIAVLGWFGVLLMPNKYESQAQIYVDTSSVLKPLLQGLAVDSNVAGETDAVTRALLARPNLEKVATVVGLDVRAKTAAERDEVLSTLAKDLVIEGDTRTSVYRLRYASPSATRAHDVIKNVLDTFVKDSVGANRVDTTNAQAFLRQQVADYESRLSESERRLAEFKKANVGLMPDDRGDYFQRMQGEMTSLQTLETSLTVARRQRDELRRKLLGDGSPGTAPLVTPTDQQIQQATEIDARLQDARRQLDELLLKYTDNHYDVVAMRDTIARLEARRRAELGSIRTTAGGLGRDGGIEADQVTQNLQIRLNAMDLDVASLSAQVEQARGRVGELRRLVGAGPEVEAELSRLNRDYGVTKAQYEALLQRLESARLSNDADRSTEIKFRIIEPPRVPDRPTSPNRSLLAVVVLLASLALGASTSYIVGRTRPVFFSEQDLAQVTGLSVVGAITKASLPEQVRARRFAIATSVGAIVTLCGVCAVLMVTITDVSSTLRTVLGMEF